MHEASRACCCSGQAKAGAARELAPGVELHVRDDAPRHSRALVDRLLRKASANWARMTLAQDV